MLSSATTSKPSRAKRLLTPITSTIGTDIFHSLEIQFFASLLPLSSLRESLLDTNSCTRVNYQSSPDRHRLVFRRPLWRLTRHRSTHRALERNPQAPHPREWNATRLCCP